MDGLRRSTGARVVALLASAAVGLATAACATQPRDPEQVLEDATVASRIKAGLLSDPVIAGSAIGVDVQDGVVTLTGRVPSEAAATRVLGIARSTEGVRRVEDRLVRESPTSSSTEQGPAPPGASGAAAPTRRPLP